MLILSPFSSCESADTRLYGIPRHCGIWINPLPSITLVTMIDDSNQFYLPTDYPNGWFAFVYVTVYITNMKRLI